MMKPKTQITDITARGREWLAISILAALLMLDTESARADAVTHWNEIMQTTVEKNPDPFVQVRSATITQLAVFQAVNSILCEYEPYGEPISAPEGASPDAAAIAAAHRALSVLHADSASTLDSLRAASLAEIPEGPARDQGIRVGESAADAILAARASDGSDTQVSYTPGTQPGEWQPTPPDFAPAFRPGMGRVKPFAIRHGAQFRLGPPPPLHSARYARDYNEVKRLGDVSSTDRPADRADVARFYEVTDGIPLYNPAARQVSEAQGKTLSQNARIFALLNMAIFDAALAVFDTKYFYNFWRPVTAIQSGNLDGNRKTERNPNWQPLAYTPPFPGYPSGHAGFGAAARRVLEHLLGEGGHSITLTNAAAPHIVLHYSSWKEITDDVDDGRIFGGVHFRFDQETAARQGRRVGTYILRHELQPTHRGERDCHAPRYWRGRAK
jgi:hypothetical protein